MTQKEINELRARVYSISNCMFPLDTFLNDIEQNENQNYDKEGAYNDLKLITDAIYELKEKLKEKEQIYTLEECKKMWEELGYKLYDGKNCLDIVDKKNGFVISIFFKSKNYYKQKINTDDLHYFTFQEHQLLTKTFKWLGWEE
jgi:hypothetical protein